MSKSIDPKSLLLGGFLALLVLTCFAGVPWLQQETFGRFTLGATDSGAFILDTATGQAWAHLVPENFVVTVPSSDEFFGPKLETEFNGPQE
ncbi:MAG: hypothetical protein KBE65_21705 [Phycisphaerae bacterium]|nr:hypothetical protein [Phycisphaerae bacterium]